jgi:glyceraldehyde-3-phosphate dehydrogenase/erythrose-4-phosphate dehydrogenase
MPQSKSVVHVVGTGTIGEPLIGLLAAMREPLGIDELTFHKRTPLVTDRSKVRALIGRGAKLAVDASRRDGFLELGIEPVLETDEALAQASVVIDCTPVGNDNKEKLYSRFTGNTRGFIAQGSEFGFGKPYARGVNDQALNPDNDQFLQVVSCNTHNLAVLLETIALDGSKGSDNLETGRFLCIRRANDISQDGSFVPAPQVGKHNDSQFGTHHARDAYHLFKTLGLELNLFSSAVKVNSQYMHEVWFNIRVRQPTSVGQVIERLQANDRIALTHKMSANQVFSFGRDHGFHGRILSQTVVCAPTVAVHQEREVIGFCFTPQDGNPLLSSIAAACWYLDPGSYEERIQCLKPYFFQEV